MSVDPSTVPHVDSARSVFLAWEKLRIAYNAVLVLLVVVVAARDFGKFDFYVYLGAAAFGANLCFCLGPVAEGYLALLGAERRIARSLTFALGTILACLLTLVSVTSWQPLPMG